jgi:hypothetical protein
MAGANLSNRPVARSSSATCRAIDIAISAYWLAVLARATPSASSSATLGDPGRTLMLIGAPSAFTSRPIVAGSRNPIGYTQSGPAVDDDRHGSRLCRLPRSADPVGGILRAAERHWAARRPVLEIDADRAGLYDLTLSASPHLPSPRSPPRYRR